MCRVVCVRTCVYACVERERERERTSLLPGWVWVTVLKFYLCPLPNSCYCAKDKLVLSPMHALRFRDWNGSSNTKEVCPLRATLHRKPQQQRSWLAPGGWIYKNYFKCWNKFIPKLLHRLPYFWRHVTMPTNSRAHNLRWMICVCTVVESS